MTAVGERALSRRFGHPEVFALMGVASFLVARFLPLLELPYRCPFKVLTGWPCASCGMTHAFVHLAHGAVGPAWVSNPFGVVFAAGLWVYAVFDLARMVVGAPRPRLDPGTVRTLLIAGLGAFLANWAWLIYATSAAR